MKLVSVVVPIYSEEELIPELYRRLTVSLCQLGDGLDYEVVFVNDGSTDGSLPILQGLASKNARISVLDLSRNFGHQVAITAGIDAARGDAVVVIDGDLQDPPEVILQMVDLWNGGYQVVYGVREKRDGERPFKLVTAALFYRLLNLLSETPLPLDAGDFRLMDRMVVDALKGMREETRYIRGMVVWIGFRQTSVAYRRDARYAGATKYTYRKMLKLALHGITSFSSRPLLLSAQFGAMVTVVSFLYGSWLIVQKLLHPESSIAGWTSVLVAILFLGGVQLISIGVLGAYLGRVFAESKRRPLYVVAGTYSSGASRLADVDQKLA